MALQEAAGRCAECVLLLVVFPLSMILFIICLSLLLLISLFRSLLLRLIAFVLMLLVALLVLLLFILCIIAEISPQIIVFVWSVLSVVVSGFEVLARVVFASEVLLMMS